MHYESRTVRQRRENMREKWREATIHHGTCKVVQVVCYGQPQEELRLKQSICVANGKWCKKGRMMVVASTMQQQQHQIQSSQPQTSPQHCNGQSTLEREDDSEGQETTSGSPPSTSAVSASGRIGNAAGVSHGSEDTRQDTVPSRTTSDQSVSAVNDKNGQHGQPCNAAGVEVRDVFLDNSIRLCKCKPLPTHYLSWPTQLSV